MIAYTGCHKYVPFARFPNRRKCRGQRIEIIANIQFVTSLYIKASRDSVKDLQYAVAGILVFLFGNCESFFGQAIKNILEYKYKYKYKYKYRY